jgi:hypothetical protein
VDASNWIALAALLVSIIVALVNWRAVRTERDARQKADEKAEERAEKRLRLLEAEVEGQAADRLRQNRAELVYRQGQRGGGSLPDWDGYDFSLVNGGAATAHDVQVWIADEEGVHCSQYFQSLGAILPNAESPTFVLYLLHQLSRSPDPPLRLRVRWADGAGDHEENIGEPIGRV